MRPLPRRMPVRRPALLDVDGTEPGRGSRRARRAGRLDVLLAQVRVNLVDRVPHEAFDLGIRNTCRLASAPADRPCARPLAMERAVPGVARGVPGLPRRDSLPMLSCSARCHAHRRRSHTSPLPRPRNTTGYLAGDSRCSSYGVVWDGGYVVPQWRVRRSATAAPPFFVGVTGADDRVRVLRAEDEGGGVGAVKATACEAATGEVLVDSTTTTCCYLTV